MKYLIFAGILVGFILGIWWLHARGERKRWEEAARLDQIVTDNLAALGVPPHVSRYWPPDVKRAVLAEREST